MAAAVLPIAIGAMGAGTLTSMYAQDQQGKATQDAYESQAAAAENEAKNIKEAAKYEEEKQLLAGERIRSRQRMLYSKAGVDITSGSPLLTLSFDEEMMRRDIGATEYNADVLATKAKNKASLDRWYGRNARTAAEVAQWGTLFQGIGNMGAMYTSSKRGTSTTQPV